MSFDVENLYPSIDKKEIAQVVDNKIKENMEMIKPLKY